MIQTSLKPFLRSRVPVDQFLQWLAELVQLTSRSIPSNVSREALAEEGAECIHGTRQTVLYAFVAASPTGKGCLLSISKV